MKRIFLLILVAGFSGCGKDSPPPGTFGAVYNDTISKACASCHSPGGAAYEDSNVTLDFSSQTKAFNTLRANSVTGATSVGICPSVKIITPGTSATSYFAAVLFSDYSHSDFVVSGCTPYSGHHSDQSLSSSEKSSIIDWINAGAQNN